MINTNPVAGIDVGKDFCEIAILAPDGSILSNLKFKQDVEGFQKVFDLLIKTEKEFGAKPTVILESTGHYHKRLFRFLTRTFDGMVINPIQTKSITNVDIRKRKNDKVDAKKIALLYLLGKCKPNFIPDESTEVLRELYRNYDELIELRTAYKNKLISILDQVIPGFLGVLDIDTKSALAVLKQYPTPQKILKSSKQKLVKLLVDTSKKSSNWANNKYESLLRIAQEAAATAISNEALNKILLRYVHVIESQNLLIDEALKDIEQYLGSESCSKSTAEDINLLCSITGIGTITAIALSGEIGSISAFKKPKKLVAFAGIDPAVQQSGNFVGTRVKISKRGSSTFRKVLYQVASANTHPQRNGELVNPVLYKLYCEKRASKGHKYAMVAVMRKLLLIIYAVLRDRKPYTPRTPEEHAQYLALKNKMHFVKTA